MPRAALRLRRAPLALSVWVGWRSSTAAISSGCVASSSSLTMATASPVGPKSELAIHAAVPGTAGQLPRVDERHRLVDRQHHGPRLGRHRTQRPTAQTLSADLRTVAVVAASAPEDGGFAAAGRVLAARAEHIGSVGLATVRTLPLAASHPRLIRIQPMRLWARIGPSIQDSCSATRSPGSSTARASHCAPTGPAGVAAIPGHRSDRGTGPRTHAGSFPRQRASRWRLLLRSGAARPDDPLGDIWITSVARVGTSASPSGIARCSFAGEATLGGLRPSLRRYTNRHRMPLPVSYE